MARRLYLPLTLPAVAKKDREDGYECEPAPSGRPSMAGCRRGLTAASYAAYVAIAWHRYGHVTPSRGPEEGDLLLDRFIPTYEVVGTPPCARCRAGGNHILGRVRHGPQAVGGRPRHLQRPELILGGKPEEKTCPLGLVDQAQAWGWGVLAEIPGREIVFGAVTQPWLANVVFRALPPDEFAAFHEPEYVKIVWTLRADPIGAAESVAAPRPALRLRIRLRARSSGGIGPSFHPGSY